MCLLNVEDVLICRTPNCEGILELRTPSTASFDPEGLIFGCSIFGENSDIVKLYDIRFFEKGPFGSFNLPKTDDLNAKAISMIFNPNGKQIIVNTDGPYIQVMDAFHGTPMLLLERPKRDNTCKLPFHKMII
jgi:COMPASS component SWD2